MALVTFIDSSNGIEHEIYDDSIAAELMRSDARFTLLRNDSANQPTNPDVKVIEALGEIGQTAAATGKALAEFAGAETIRGLMLIQEQKTWRSMGYKSFGQFLDSKEVPWFGKTKFYKLRDFLLREGDVCFDAQYRASHV